MRILKNPNIQFVKYRYWAYAFSIVVLLIGLGYYIQWLELEYRFHQRYSRNIELES
jgi:hypothetical protein